MPRKYLGNLRGPQGISVSSTRIVTSSGPRSGHLIVTLSNGVETDAGLARGADGIPGTGAVPADAAVGGYIGTEGTSQTKTALATFLGNETSDADTAFRTALDNLYDLGISPRQNEILAEKVRELMNSVNYGHNLTGTLDRWKAARILASGGGAAARIAVHGGSSPYGHWGGGPYLTASWPGRLQRILSEKYGGQIGTGMMIPWSLSGASGPGLYHPEWNFQGSIENRPLSVYGLGSKRITKTGTTSYIEVGPVYGDTARVIVASTSGVATAIVDGATVGTFALIGTASSQTLPMVAGYANNGSGGGQIVTDIPLGQLGWHTLRFYPNDTAGLLTLLSVESLVTGRGGVVVSNLGLSGIASQHLLLDDATTGFTGMSMSVDASRSVLQIVQCTTNDYQGHVAIATYKDRLKTFIARARTATPVANGGTTIPSDVLLVAGQPVNEAKIPADGIRTPPFNDYTAAVYDVATTEGVALLDLNEMFVDFATGNAKGWYADDLHPSPHGHEAIAQAVARVLTD